MFNILFIFIISLQMTATRSFSTPWPFFRTSIARITSLAFSPSLLLTRLSSRSQIRKCAQWSSVLECGFTRAGMPHFRRLRQWASPIAVVVQCDSAPSSRTRTATTSTFRSLVFRLFLQLSPMIVLGLACDILILHHRDGLSSS